MGQRPLMGEQTNKKPTMISVEPQLLTRFDRAAKGLPVQEKQIVRDKRTARAMKICKHNRSPKRVHAVLAHQPDVVR